MLKNIRVRSIDFVFAINLLLDNQNYQRDIKKMGVEPSKEIELLVEELSGSVSMRLFEDLKTVFKKYYLDALIVNYAIKFPSLKPMEIIEELNKLGSDGLYDAYVKEVVKPKGPGEHEIKARIDEIFENNTTQFIMNYGMLKKFKTESVEIFPKFIEITRQFASIYANIEMRIDAIYDREIINFKDEFEDENKFRNSFLMIQFDGSTDSIKKIDVCITVIPEYMLMYKMSEDRSDMTVLVGFGMKKIASTQEATLSQEVFKSLGDPTKLMIIQMAAKEPLCAKDLAIRLQLSKATISHHLSILITLKMLTLNLQDGKKLYYSTNKELLKRLFENFISDLI